MTELAQRWIDVWNGDLALADDLLTDGFRIHFGDPGPLADPDVIVGPAMMTAYVRAYREYYPTPSFVIDEVLPSGPGFAFRWTVSIGDVSVSGIDVVHTAGQQIERVWSVTASRRLPA
jgi:hypothetical protein